MRSGNTIHFVLCHQLMQLVVVVRDSTRPNNYTDTALGPDLQIRLNPHLYASMARTGRCRQGANFKKTLIGASHYYYTSTLAHSRRSAMLSHVPHHQAILKFSVGFPYIRGSSCVQYILFVPRGRFSLGPCFSPQQQSKLQVRVANLQYVMTCVCISH